jgi:2,5-diketo-D-gluconate reductase A
VLDGMAEPTTPSVPSIKLSDGTTIPQVGYGVWQVPAAEAEAAVGEALRLGYRHIDTAAAYGNEEGVGAAVRSSGLDREEIVVVTKVRNGEQGYDNTIQACEDSIDRLGVGAIDVYLIHWAAPVFGTYVDTWKALVALRDAGKVRSIGVSNFNPPHLEAIIEATGVVPVMNQVELHPYLQQPALRAEHDRLGIVTEAWSPLGQGRGLLDEPVLAEVGARVGASPAQVALAWQLALGHVVIPKSVTPSRIAENLAAVDIALSDDDLATITALDRAARYGADPDTVTFTQMG